MVIGGNNEDFAGENPEYYPPGSFSSGHSNHLSLIWHIG